MGREISVWIIGLYYTKVGTKNVDPWYDLKVADNEGDGSEESSRLTFA